MLTMLVSPRGSNGLTRRDTLKFGAMSLLGGFLNLPNLQALEENRKQHVRPGKAKSVILLYLHGGAPTQDMFDLKPSAPAEIRGEFKPIATNVNGIQISEHLPRTSRWMHRCAIVRRVNHKAGCHNTLTGSTGDEQVVDINDPIPKDTFPPGMGAVCEYLKPPAEELPHYVAVPNYLGWGWALKRPGPWGGFLGKRFDPLCAEYKPELEKNPGAGRRPMWLGTPYLADADVRPGMTLDRLDKRKTLLQQLDEQQRLVEATGDSHERIRRRAFSMLTGSKLKAAFDLDHEDPRVRDRYGRSVVGSSALIARR